MGMPRLGAFNGSLFVRLQKTVREISIAVDKRLIGTNNSLCTRVASVLQSGIVV